MPTHDRPPRVVLVTGASSGIGEAAAHRVARRGDHLVLLARGRDALERVARDCDDLGAASSTVLAADISKDDEVGAAVAATIARHGWIDTVVGSAGVVAYGRVEDVPAEVFDQVVSTNLLGSVNLARHVLPVLRRQGGGSLVMVGSVIGHIAVPDMAAYVISKWGVRALVRQLQVDNRDSPGVRNGAAIFAKSQSSRRVSRGSITSSTQNGSAVRNGERSRFSRASISSILACGSGAASISAR